MKINIQSERGFPDYVKSKQYNIQWSHGQDPKASANSRFSASVNFQVVVNILDNSLNLSNIGSTLNNNLVHLFHIQKHFKQFHK